MILRKMITMMRLTMMKRLLLQMAMRQLMAMGITTMKMRPMRGVGKIASRWLTMAVKTMCPLRSD